MALCKITGTVYLPSGELARSKTIAFRRSDRKITAEYLGVVLPTDVLTRTDVAGLIEVELLTGVYTVFAEGFSALATVPDAPTADFSDIIALAEPIYPAPTWLNQAFEARNEAVAAAGDAAGSADAAAVSASEAAADALVGSDALVVANRAEAAAVPMDSYAAALAAPKPPSQTRISAIVSGRLVEWVRQAGGTCLGGGWVPAGEVKAGHFNGDIVAAAAYAVANPKYDFYQSFMRTNVIGSASAPWLSVSPSTVAQPKNHLFVRQETQERNDPITVQIQRIVNSDDGLPNPKALRAVTVVNVDTDQTEWAISGELDSYSNVASTGNTAVSGVANKYGRAQVFAGHFQGNDRRKYETPSDVTAIVGVEMNLQVVGRDNPSQNQGYGARYVMDVLPRTNKLVPGWNDPTGNYGEGEVGVGIRVRCDNVTGAFFKTGIAILDGQGNPNAMAVGLRVGTSGNYGIQLSGVNTAAHIFSNGNAATGAVFAGEYTTGNAIRVSGGQSIAIENTGAIKTNYASGVWGFYNGENQRVGFDMSAAPRVRIAGTPVLGARRTGWTADTGTAKRTANVTYSATAEAVYTQEQVQSLMDAVRDLSQTVKAMKDDMIAHGMFGA